MTNGVDGGWVTEPPTTVRGPFTAEVWFEGVATGDTVQAELRDRSTGDVEYVWASYKITSDGGDRLKLNNVMDSAELSDVEPGEYIATVTWYGRYRYVLASKNVTIATGAGGSGGSDGDDSGDTDDGPSMDSRKVAILGAGAIALYVVTR